MMSAVPREDVLECNVLDIHKDNLLCLWPSLKLSLSKATFISLDLVSYGVFIAVFNQISSDIFHYCVLKAYLAFSQLRFYPKFICAIGDDEFI